MNSLTGVGARPEKQGVPTPSSSPVAASSGVALIRETVSGTCPAFEKARAIAPATLRVLPVCEKQISVTRIDLGGDRAQTRPRQLSVLAAQSSRLGRRRTCALESIAGTARRSGPRGSGVGRDPGLDHSTSRRTFLPARPMALSPLCGAYLSAPNRSTSRPRWVPRALPPSCTQAQ